MSGTLLGDGTPLLRNGPRGGEGEEAGVRRPGGSGIILCGDVEGEIEERQCMSCQKG